MKKVGIITFHRAVNYGAVFQTFALQNILTKLGYYAEVIDYRSTYIESVYEAKIDFDNVKKMCFDILSFSKRKRKRDNFYDFIEKEIPLSPFTNANSFDVLITGSDQVWNTDMTGNDETFFLKFGNKDQTKISYAACSGKANYGKEEQRILRNNLEEFRAISVRDNATQKNIEKIIQKSVDKTIDPTLLLSRSEWNTYVENVKYTNYILVFAVGFSEALSDFAHSLAKKKNCRLVFINANLRKKGKGIYLDTIGPDMALSLMAHANYIVTNSFHGTAMSIALGQDFFVELNHDVKGRNLRVEDLLKEFDIEGREILSSQYSEYDYEEINWKKIRAKQEVLCRQSVDFLKKAIDG